MPNKTSDKLIVPDEIIMNKIYFIREQKVMLDSDLAELYGVETKVLKRQVRRNIERFPDDFMFELTKVEFKYLRSQIVTSSWGGTRYLDELIEKRNNPQVRPEIGFRKKK